MGLKECGLNLSRDNKELKPHGTIDFPCAGYSSCYRDSEDDIKMCIRDRINAVDAAEYC